MAIGLLGNESPDLNRFLFVTSKPENGVRLQATPGNQNPTDLVELKKGDMFYITINREKLAYTVDEIAITEPSDVSKLKIYENKNYVTLYTCTPYGQNTHRLLVRGRLTPYSKEKYEAQQKTFWDKIFQSSWLKEYYKAIIWGVLLVLIINVMYKKISKGKK